MMKASLMVKIPYVKTYNKATTAKTTRLTTQMPQLSKFLSRCTRLLLCYV